MRLAFYTYSYTDRLELPLVASLERIAQTGYQGIDVSGTHGKSQDPRSVSKAFRKLTRETAERLELRIEAVITHAELTTSLSSRTPLDLEGSVDLAVELGAPIVTFHMGGPAHDAGRRREMRRRVVEYLRKAVGYAEARHVKLADDGIWPTWIVDTPKSLLELFEAVGSTELAVNFDPSYLTLAGFDPAEVADEWRDRIVHAHCKDHVGRYPDFEHRIPGRGDMDYVRVFRALAKIGFEGALAVETFTDMKFETACDEGFAALSAAKSKANDAGSERK